MEIDIIRYTDEQYETLTETQLQEVYKAQEKKDRLTWKMENAKEAEKERLVKNGTFVSGIWAATCTRLEEEYEREVEIVRSALLFYLRFSMREGGSAPYTVDYTLSEVDRALIVRAYYDKTYEDAYERFVAFKADTVAIKYLGEAYAPTWDYFYWAAQG